ncbi:hypothetical protein LguiA_030332 [Lonicera macranthoides]
MVAGEWGSVEMEEVRERGEWSGSKLRCESGYLSRNIIMERARRVYLELPVRFTRKRTKELCKRRRLRMSLFFTHCLRNQDSIRFGNYIVD